MTDRLLRAASDVLRDRGVVEAATLDRVTVGDAAILVETVVDGTGTAGLAHRPDDADPPAVPSGVDELLAPVDGEDRRPSTVERALAAATLNALSAPYVEWESGDPMALLSPSVGTVVTVGLFRPAFRKFDGVEVRVIERGTVDDVDAPSSVRVRTFTPDRTAEAMGGADVVFLTGSTLVYGGLERYLDSVPADAATVVIGATASMVPDPLFAAGVDVLAGAAVRDRRRARAAVSAGACGTDLHDHGVEKGYVRSTPDAATHFINPS